MTFLTIPLPTNKNKSEDKSDNESTTLDKDLLSIMPRSRPVMSSLEETSLIVSVLNRQAVASEDIQVYQPRLSEVDPSDVYFDQNLERNVLADVIEYNEHDNILEDYIRGDLKKNSENKVLDFIFSIENNNSFLVNSSIFDNVLSYKEKLLKNKYQKIENKFNMFCSVNSNNVKLHSIFLNKFNLLNKVYNLVIEGIEEKTQIVKNNLFEEKLKSDIYSDQGKYFNKVVNFFIENFLENNREFLQKNLVFLETNESFVDNLFNYNKDNFPLLEKSLIGFEKDQPFNFVNSLKTTSNDIVIQAFVNFARSFYTISTNCLVDNYKSDSILKIDFNRDSIKCLVTEKEGFRPFSYIDKQNINTDIDDIISNNYLKTNNEINYLQNNEDSLVSSDSIS